MPDYVPPLRDIRFVLEHIVDIAGLSRLEPFGHADPDAVFGVLEEGGRFMAEVLAPLNRPGDVEGSRRDQAGNVTTPTGFKSAYRRYVDAGWGACPSRPSLAAAASHG
jgi:3-(methylthio)propanoyl-CoA dehydrogenase